MGMGSEWTMRRIAEHYKKCHTFTKRSEWLILPLSVTKWYVKLRAMFILSKVPILYVFVCLPRGRRRNWLIGSPANCGVLVVFHTRYNYPQNYGFPADIHITYNNHIL